MKDFRRAIPRLGVCYYPEHWPVSRHEPDIRRMAKAGFQFVRMGEGAWGYWEPHEGQFQFDLFDRVIELCAQHGLKVILGTPTYAGPAWIAANHPQVLRWDFNRQPMTHGSRRNFNYTSPKYLELSDRICTALAEHYQDNPQVIAWQLDNEFNCHMDVSYAPSDTLAFRQWLQRKYKSLDQLNRAWGTSFWSQQYDDWNQIDLPHPTATYLNPSLILDETRFISDCVVGFARHQAMIIRKFNHRWAITHNGLFANINGPDLARQLDFFSHDQYPLFNRSWPQMADSLVQARSLSFPFGILEQQSGPGGQMSYFHRTPRRGELRLWSWQSVAHGADFISYFRWRTCPFGSEQHWHGLLDQDNKNTARLKEAGKFGAELKKLPRDFFDAPPVKNVAILRDFENEANERRINTYAKSGAAEHARWLAALARRHIPADYVWPESSLGGYRILIAPHQKIVTLELAKKLQQFVESGGTLILGAQAGIKDANCHMVQRTPPGLLAKLAGVEMADWTTLPDDQSRSAQISDGPVINLGTFVERLRLKGAARIANWIGEDPLLGNTPAITRNQAGKGRVYYIAGYCQEPAITSLLDHLATELNLRPIVSAGDCVEVIHRKGKSRTYIVLLNHTSDPQTISRFPAAMELISGEKLNGELSLDGLEVAILAARSLPGF